MPLTNLARLKDEEWERLEQLADRFEDEWRQGREPRLEDFLPAPQDPLRTIALYELIKTDLEVRCRRGQKVLLESYLELFPELGSARELTPHLIHEEFRIRQVHGDKPALAAYRERFPDQFDELRRLAAASQWVPVNAATPSAPPSPLKPPGSPLPEVKMQSGSGPFVTGGYELLSRIGGGGFGEVWKARAPGGFTAAVKIIFHTLDHEEAQRELKSLEAIKDLSHPYLLSTQASWCEGGRLYIAMGLADGTLRDRLKLRQGQGHEGIPFEELFRSFYEAAEALDYLHNTDGHDPHKGVLHCDVKPDNLLLQAGHVKVADFGLARLRGPDHTVEASGSGTAHYMAPEVFWENKFSERSDLYSLAVSYAELRQGRRPFNGSSMMELMNQHREGTPDLAGLLPAEREVILKALSKDRALRHASCLEFAQHLEQALLGARTEAGLPFRGRGGSSGEIPRPPAPTPTKLPETVGRRKSIRRRLLWAAVLVFGLVPVILGAVWYFSKDGGRTADTGKGTELEPVPTVWNDHWVKGEGAKLYPIEGGRTCYDKIAYKMDDGTLIDFVLIPQNRGSIREGQSIPSFYIMVDKVSIDLYVKLAAEPAQKKNPLNPEWLLGARLEGKGGALDGLDLGVNGGRLPVLRVAVADADRFAHRLGGNCTLRDFLTLERRKPPRK